MPDFLSKELHLCHSTRGFHEHYQDFCHFSPTCVIVHGMPSARLGQVGHYIANRNGFIIQYIHERFSGRENILTKKIRAQHDTYIDIDICVYGSIQGITLGSYFRHKKKESE